MLVLLLCLCAGGLAAGQQRLVRVDVRGPDKDLSLEIQKAANDAIRTQKNAALVADASAGVIVRISFMPIQLQDPAKLYGMSLAIVVTHHSSRREAVKTFVHQVVPMTSYLELVKQTATDAVN